MKVLEDVSYVDLRFHGTHLIPHPCIVNSITNIGNFFYFQKKVLFICLIISNDTIFF